MPEELVPKGHFTDPLGSMDIPDDAAGAGLPFYKIEYLAGDPPKGFKAGLITVGPEEQAEAVEFIALTGWHIGNILYPPYKPGEKSEALCFSDEGGHKPIGGTDPKDVTSCAKCGLSDMQYYRDHGEKPPCAKTQAVLGYDLERDQVFRFHFKRKARERYVEWVRQMGEHKPYGSLQVSWCLKCRLTTEPLGRAYMPVLEIVEPVAEDLARHMQDVYSAVQTAASQASVSQDDVERSSDNAGGAGDDDLPEILR